MRWSGSVAAVSVVLVAVMFVMPAAVSAKNNSTGGENAPMGIVCGHIYDASTGELLSGGAVLIIEIIDKQSGYPIYDMVYGGYYEFTKVPEGVYTLKSVCNGYEIIFREGVEVVRSEVAVEDFVMRRTGEINGIVKDAVTLAPVPGAFVYVLEGPDYTAKYTNADGGFTLFPLLPGFYTLKIEKEGYALYTHPYPVPVYEWRTTQMSSLYLTPL